MFCCRSHRQRAYEARRRADSLQIPVGEVVVSDADLRSLHDRLYRLETAIEDVQTDLGRGRAPRPTRKRSRTCMTRQRIWSGSLGTSEGIARPATFGLENPGRIGEVDRWISDGPRGGEASCQRRERVAVGVLRLLVRIQRRLDLGQSILGDGHRSVHQGTDEFVHNGCLTTDRPQRIPDRFILL